MMRQPPSGKKPGLVSRESAALTVTLASVASEQVGSRQRLQHRLQLLRQQPLAFRLQVLEVRIRRDGRFHGARAAQRLAHCVLQHAEEASQHRALLANLLGQPLQAARLPEVAYVAYRGRVIMRALAAQPFLIDSFRLAAQYPPRERRVPHPLRLFLVNIGRLL